MNLLDLYYNDMCHVCGQTPCNCTHIAEEKVRLDPKCWKGKKIGNPKTKMKGGVRVNNCVPAESVAEGVGNIGHQIKALYQKIYDQGDDAVEFMYNDSPIFAQYWDEYEGDLDSIIAEVDPQELQVILAELQSAVEDQGVTEMDTQQPKGRIKSDGTRSHSTYGSRDHYSDADPQHTAKPTKAEKMMKHAHDVMMKSMSTADKVEKGWRNPNIDEQGVAEGFPHDVDHMPGPTIKNPQTGCQRCHGKGYVYKTADGKVLPSNEQGAKRYKCGACGGIGFVKQGVAEGSVSQEELARLAYDAYVKATRQGNGTMAAHYLAQHQRHKKLAAIEKKKGVAEVSDATLTSYLTKVDADSQKHDRDPTKRNAEKRNRSVQGFARAFNKLDARKEKTTEVSKGTLGSYLKRAHQDVVDRASSSSFQSGQAGDKYNRADATAKDQKREQGMARAISRLTTEGLADEFMKLAQARGYNPRLRGTPEQELERTQQMLAQRAVDRAAEEKRIGQEDFKIIDQLKDQYQKMSDQYQSLGGSNWQYADREQNLSDHERQARSMEPTLRDLAARIARAEKYKDQTNEQSGLGFGENKEANYGDKYQSMVQRVGQRAREQEKTRPVDIQDLARRLRAIEQSKDDK